MWWIAEPKKLSTEQRRVLGRAVRHGHPIALSDMTLLEIAARLNRRNVRLAQEVLQTIGRNPHFRILPVTIEIAMEAIDLIDALRDPSDCAIVATARVHGLRLLTSDQRIIQSKLVPVE